MKVSVLTYNVLYNNALNYIGEILSAHSPDIVCLQEVDTDEHNLKKMENFGYRLADYSNSFLRFDKIFGIATFYNPSILRSIDSNRFPLPRSVYEFFLMILRILRGGNKPRTVLKTDFVAKGNSKKLTIYNVHLTLVATNQGRVKHLKKIIDFVSNHKNISTIITGDFNYFPYSRKQLDQLMKNNGFKEATNKITYTSRLSSAGKFEKFNFIQKIFSKIIQKLLSNRFKLDYIFYKNMKLIEAERLEIKASDHYPIIARFDF